MIRLSIVVLLVTARLAAGEAEPMDFGTYWYHQGAEITRYELDQARYGEQHAGEAVFIFVTEPFDKALQVKSDDPEAPTAVPALKLNRTRRFLTGIYPYRMMTSVFQPIGRPGGTLPRALKITSSTQEWCGQTFLQFNRRKDQWRVREFSYFQSEGDTDRICDGCWLGDELLVRLRLGPGHLPQGRIRLVPAAELLRLYHGPRKCQPATATLTQEQAADGTPMLRYAVKCHDIEYAFDVTCTEAFPHTIETWSETWKGQTSTAVKTHREFKWYWDQNKNRFRGERESLGLPTDR